MTQYSLLVTVDVTDASKIRDAATAKLEAAGKTSTEIEATINKDGVFSPELGLIVLLEKDMETMMVQGTTSGWEGVTVVEKEGKVV